MADRHQRGNKEARKPKKDKAPPKTEVPFGSQVKLAGSTERPAGGKK